MLSNRGCPPLVAGAQIAPSSHPSAARTCRAFLSCGGDNTATASPRLRTAVSPCTAPRVQQFVRSATTAAGLTTSMIAPVMHGFRPLTQLQHSQGCMRHTHATPPCRHMVPHCGSNSSRLLPRPAASCGAWAAQISPRLPRFRAAPHHNGTHLPDIFWKPCAALDVNGIQCTHWNASV